MKRNNTEKLKKTHLYPVIIVLIVVMFVVAAAVSLIASAIGYNMTKGKLNQGYKLAHGCYKQIKETSSNDWSEAERIFHSYEKSVPDVTGVTIFRDGVVLYSIGEKVADEKTSILEYINGMEDFEGSKYEDNCEVYLATTEDSFFQKFAKGKIGYIIKTSIEAIDSTSELFDESMGETIFEQNCYFEFQNDDGTVTAITTNIYITMQDVFLVFMVCIGIILICFIYLLFVVFMIVRFFRNQRKLFKLYYADKETGGKNWYYFLERAAKRMKKYRKKSVNAAIIHIRMEKYRSYCSCYGEAAGSKLLSDFYEVLQKNVAKKEVFARHEMCDFGLLLCYDSEEQLVERVGQIIKELENMRPKIKLYFKVGINRLDKEVMDPSEAYNRATIARRNIEDVHNESVKFFTQAMKDDLLWERKVENEMERALHNHEYKVYLQPKYSVDKEKLAAAEALVRWVHPTEGLIAPYKFIPIFEKNGFITKLDDYMIGEVARLQSEWIAQGKKIVPISVNVSRAHFTQDNLAEHVCEIVDGYKVPHDAIELELTESAFFDDKKTLIDIVKKMKSYGFAVSMDDFGAGYSSLNSLKELPIDIVKLDAEFFRGNDEEGKGKVIVGEAIGLAKKLNMRIVAEGIETREQVDFLADNECDLIQGYYFAKPMPVDEFEVKMAEDGIA